jgi:hypothetical protein
MNTEEYKKLIGQMAGGFTIMPNALIDFLSPKACKTFLKINQLSFVMEGAEQGGMKWISISQSYLAEVMGVHRNTAPALLNELVSLNIIKSRNANRKNTVYAINWEEVTFIAEQCYKLSGEGVSRLQKLCCSGKTTPLSMVDSDKIKDIRTNFVQTKDSHKNVTYAPKLCESEDLCTENCANPGYAQKRDICTEIVQTDNYMHKNAEKEGSYALKLCESEEKSEICTKIVQTENPVCTKTVHTENTESRVCTENCANPQNPAENPDEPHAPEAGENPDLHKNSASVCTKIVHNDPGYAQKRDTVINNNIIKKNEGGEAPYRGGKVNESLKNESLEEGLEGEEKVKVEKKGMEAGEGEPAGVPSREEIKRQVEQRRQEIAERKGEEDIGEGVGGWARKQEALRSQTRKKVEILKDYFASRDESYVPFGVSLLESIMEEPISEGDDNVVKTIKQVWPQLAYEEGDASDNFVPLDFFHNVLFHSWSDLKDQYPDYTLTEDDLKNIFCFEFMEHDGEVQFCINPAMVKDLRKEEDIKQREIASRKKKVLYGDRTSRRIFLETIEEVAKEDEALLTDAEFNVVLLTEQNDKEKRACWNTEVLPERFDEILKKFERLSNVPADDIKEKLFQDLPGRGRITLTPNRLVPDRFFEYNRQVQQDSEVERRFLKKLDEERERLRQQAEEEDEGWNDGEGKPEGV